MRIIAPLGTDAGIHRKKKVPWSTLFGKMTVHLADLMDHTAHNLLSASRMLLSELLEEDEERCLA